MHDDYQGIPGCEYRIDRFVAWPHEVHAFVEDFVERFGVFPDALVASPATFARMDIAADPGKIQDAGGERPHATSYTALGGLRANDYELTFFVNDDVYDRGVWLVREVTDPDGEGEPVVSDEGPTLRAVG